MKFDLGFLGGGQLARMSILAAHRMGLLCLSLDPTERSSAAQVAESVVGSLHDPEAIATVLRQCQRVTLENEFIPAAALEEAFRLAGRDPAILTPGIETLRVIQDKLAQRQAYARAGVPSPRAEDLTQSNSLGVFKQRFGGYDGKGTLLARTEAERDAALAEIGPGIGWLVEAFVPFRRELAVMVFVGDQVGTFPTMETIQVDQVCDLVFPAGVDASEIALAAVRAVNGRGLFGVELFELEDGSFQVNEIAPRPHNTGHYTLDWGATSQFEQHVRLAMGWPVDPAPQGVEVTMANLLGRVDPARPFHLEAATTRALTHAGVHVHWYGKEVRPGRKVGHLNAVGPNSRERAVRAREAFWGA